MKPEDEVWVRKPTGEIVRLGHLPAKVLLALDEWMANLKNRNGGFGEFWGEVANGEIKRFKPTESWLTSAM